MSAPSTILRERDRKVKRLTSNIMRLVSDSEKKVFNEITKDVLDKLQFDSDGVARSSQNIRRLSTLKRIERNAKKEKKKIIGSALAGMREQLKSSREYFQEISGKQRLAANQSVKQVFNEKFGINSKGKITRGALYNLMNNGEEFRSVVKSVQSGIMGRALISEVKAQAKRAFMASPQSYSNVIGHTLREAFAVNERQIDKQYADELDIQFYQYTGGFVDRTRDFCKERIGNVYHISEIEDWRNFSWKGKSNPYDPWTDVGGYNCLHMLRPISNEMAASRGKRIEDYI